MQNNEYPQLDVYKKALINLCKNKQRLNETEYLTHALLSIAIYNIPQECSIMGDAKTQCISDRGTDGVSIDTLERCFELNNHNPHTGAMIMAETLYLIRCIKPGFNLGEARYIFKADEFAKYEVAYAKAQELLKKIHLNQSIDNDDTSKEVCNFIKIFDIITIVQNSDSAKEIDNLLKEYKLSLPVIRTLINSPQYQAKFTASGEGILENFRNFVIKCVLAIMHCIKFCFTTESPSQRFNYYKDDSKNHATSEKLNTFKSYIADSLKREVDRG